MTAVTRTGKRLALGAGALAFGGAKTLTASIGSKLLERAASGITDFVVGQITKTLTSTVLVSYDDSDVAYAAVNQWVAKNCEHARRSVRVDENAGSDVEMFGRIHVGVGEYWFRYRVSDTSARRGYRTFVVKAVFSREPLERSVNPLINITVYGDGRGLVIAELKNMVEHANNGMQEVLLYEEYHHTTTRFIPLRSLDSVILNQETKSTLMQHLDWFIGARPFFSERGMTYKTAMMFYGPPGTGKTSLCRGIAHSLGYRICIAKLEDIPRMASSSIKPKTLFVIEDIDKSLAKLKAFQTYEESKEDADPRAIYDAAKYVQVFMQFLDGLLSVDDTVTIITTNHPEVLPPELLRVGRFNLKLFVDVFTETEARMMCDSFAMPYSVIDEMVAEGKDWTLPVHLHQELIERRYRRDSKCHTDNKKQESQQ